MGKSRFTGKRSDEIQAHTSAIDVVQGMNSDVAALYIESLNEMTNQQALRIVFGLQARIPSLIWVLLFSLLFLGMFATGYQASVSNAGRRSWKTPVFIMSFSILIVLIAALDRAQSKFKGVIKLGVRSLSSVNNSLQY